MKLSLFIVGLLFIVSSFAFDYPELEVSNFNGQYSADHGTATAGVWQLPNEQRSENADFEVFREETQFRLIWPEGETIIENLPDFFYEVNSLHWSNAYVKSNKKSLFVGWNFINGSTPEFSLNFSNFSAQCGEAVVDPVSDLGRSIIDSCLKEGALRFSQFRTTQNFRKPFMWHEFWKLILKDIDASEFQTLANDLSLKNLRLTLSDSYFSADLRVESGLNVNVKAYGVITPEYSSQGTEMERVRIRLDKVKASFFTITDKVFDAVRDLKNPKITVQKPYIIIELQ